MKCNHIDKASTRLDLTSLRVRVALCRIPACVFLLLPPLLSSVVQVSDCRLPQWSRMFPPSPSFLSLHPFSCHVCPCVRSFVLLSLFAIPLFGQAISSRADCVGLSHLFGQSQCQCQVYHTTQQRRRRRCRHPSLIPDHESNDDSTGSCSCSYAMQVPLQTDLATG